MQKKSATLLQAVIVLGGFLIMAFLCNKFGIEIHLAILAAWFLAMGVGMIGIENIINSFCHIRMPVFITSLSTIYSLIFAIIIGSICVVVIEKFVKKLLK